VTERTEHPGREPAGVTRRSLLAGSAGAATTMIAVTTVSPALAATRLPGRAVAVPAPDSPIPPEPVVAYIHDAARSQVTVIAGEVERTYHDPALTRRLLDAANTTLKGGN
jgi:hypothetical protein